MSLVTDRKAPADVPVSSDTLASLPDDVFDTPPAYLTFSASPAPMETPPAFGDTIVYMVRAKCVAEHGPIERKDGEQRYTRTMQLQAVWLPGQQPPTADDDEQPALIATDGSIDPETVGEIAEKIIDRPAFSNLTGDRDE